MVQEWLMSSKHKEKRMTDLNHPEYFSLTMVRDHLEDLPSFACPPGYTLRTFRPGDAAHWARIETLAGEFPSEEEALRHFEKEFGSHMHEVTERCFLLEDSQGVPIGTAMAWRGEFHDEVRGRVHWVGIVPDSQGRGLSKPLLSAVMQHLAHDHSAAYLTTQTTSYRAVNLYLKFGFLPYLAGAEDARGWQIVEELLGRRILR
jgi:ribosomal protein S18 acetylase RimI-like enzyme